MSGRVRVGSRAREDAAKTLTAHPEERRQQATGGEERSRSTEYEGPEPDDQRTDREKPRGPDASATEMVAKAVEKVRVGTRLAR